MPSPPGKARGREKARQEVSEILRSLETGAGSIRTRAPAPGARKALLLGVGLSLFGQLTGVNIVVY